MDTEDLLPSLDDFNSGRVKTLGWDILGWGTAMLAQPDEIGGTKGDQWTYTREQALFILRFYAVDGQGKFLYRRAVLERVKGWGKSPLLAAICCSEMIGPVRFDGWDSDGEPVGKQAGSPLVQIAAISDSQADNTMTCVGAMLAEGEAANNYDLDIMMSKVTSPGNRKIEKVTASPRGREGNRATFIVMDETHLWVPAEHGPQLAEALRRNAAKMNARSIETTNAHVPGEESVAEKSYNAWLMMSRGEASGILFDTKESSVEDIYDWEQSYPALVECYGDAAEDSGGWVSMPRIWEEINDPDTPEYMARRFYFNEKTEGKSTWLNKGEVNAIQDDTIELDPHNDRFALGFKGSIRNGASALVGCRLEDNALFLLGLWEKPENAPSDWEVPFAEVDTRIRRTLNMYGCVRLIADPENWQEIIGRISGDYPDYVEELWLDKNRGLAVKAVEQFETATRSQRLKFKDGNIERHILNAHTEDTPQGTIIRKETKKSKRYISVAQASLVALEAAVTAIEDGLNAYDDVMYGF